MEWWPAYLLLGAMTGFFAGLLGIGGGLIMVPVLTFIFSAQHFPADRILHLALGTTMAAIIFTSVSSLRTHHAHGVVNWQVVRYMTPGIIVGTLGGATLAGALSSRFLSVVFVVFIFYAATQMLLKTTPQPSRQLPGKAGMFAAGNMIGVVSSLVAIGGGLLMPSKKKVSMRRFSTWNWPAKSTKCCCATCKCIRSSRKFCTSTFSALRPKPK